MPRRSVESTIQQIIDYAQYNGGTCSVELFNESEDVYWARLVEYDPDDPDYRNELAGAEGSTMLEALLELAKVAEISLD